MYLENQPDDILINEVLPELSLRELKELCTSSIRFKKLCEYDELWRRKVLIEFPRSYISKPADLNWFEYYREKLREKLYYLRSQGFKKFTNENRLNVRRSFNTEKVPASELMKRLGEIWRSMSLEKRQVYQPSSYIG